MDGWDWIWKEAAMPFKSWLAIGTILELWRIGVFFFFGENDEGLELIEPFSAFLNVQ